MRLAITGLCALALLAGCGEKSDPVQDAADVAEIEAMQDGPPPQPVDPERISYTDIEQHNLFGAGCGFAPDGGMAITFLAQEDHGYLKLDGGIAALAPDIGSAKLPMPGYVKYDGKELAVELTLEQGAGEQSGIESIKFPGTMIIRDSQGRAVYEKSGTLGCGS